MDMNYDEIAETYDRYRGGHGPQIAALIEVLEGCLETFGRQSGSVRRPATTEGRPHLLEIGAGTGNSTRAVQAAHPCDLTALDMSWEMLTRGRAKGGGARWLQGSALALPFAARSFDAVYATYVLHHIADLDRLFRECARVLSGGCAVFVTAPRSFIRAYPMKEYFPSFVEADLARFRPRDELVADMERAGFSRVESRVTEPEYRAIDADYVERIGERFISTYRLLPPEEFETGLARLRADVARKGRLDKPLAYQALLVWGFA